MSGLKIAVTGSGIGGLAAAVSLRQACFDADVYEQAQELTTIGGGINMGPNAVRVLYGLGLRAGMDREGVRPLTHHQRRWDIGSTLAHTRVNPRCEELYGAPHITIHGADLGLELGNQSWVGAGAHFVHYYVARGRLLNFVGWTEHDAWNRDDWTDRATIAHALAAFESWHPQVRRIIGAADACFIWALFDRDPLPRWSVA